MLRPLLTRLAVLSVPAILLLTGFAAAGPDQGPPPRDRAQRVRPSARVVTVTAQRDSARSGRVRWVDPVRTAAPQTQPPGAYTELGLRGWFFSVAPWGVTSYYVIPEYEGPKMEQGYGRGYDALGYRYGLEEEYFEQRYNPYYNAFGPLQTDPTGAAYYRGLRGSDIATPGRHLNLRDMNRRAERLLAAHERAYALGLKQLHRGQYARAIVSFTLAARLNQSDPASRLMLTLARLAQGHHAEAAAAIRRAVELQPQLIYLELPLERHYPRAGLLASFTDRLAAWVRQQPDDADARFLLGYLRFRQGRLAQAFAVLREASKLRPQDRLVQELLEVARPPAEPRQ